MFHDVPLASTSHSRAKTSKFGLLPRIRCRPISQFQGVGHPAVLHHPQREESTDAGWGFSGTRLVVALQEISNPSVPLGGVLA